MVTVFLAQGFEEIEALAPVDLMRRAGLTVITVAVGEGSVVTGAHGMSVATDAHINDIEDCEEAELLMLPGGMPGTSNLNASAAVHRLIDSALYGGKRVAAICAAPMILGKMGLLNGKKAVCYPGFEEYLKGAEISDQKVVSDGKIITAKGVGAAVEFGLLLVEAIKDKATAKKLRRSTISE